MATADFEKAKYRLNSLYEKQTNEKRNWFRVCMLQWVVIIVLVIGFVVAISLSKPYPWIVQVDEHGFEVSVGAAGKQEVDPRIVISRIGRFIEASRTVISDPVGQQEMLKWCYAAVPQESKALKTFESSIEKIDPFKLAIQNKTVQVIVNNILPKGGNTYQATWTEQYYAGANLEKEIDFSGLFVVSINPGANGADKIKNPLGIFIEDYNFGPNYIQK